MIFLKGTCQKYSPMAKTTGLPKTGGSLYSLLPLYILALGCRAKNREKVWCNHTSDVNYQKL